jgi:hypothetical protein
VEVWTCTTTSATAKTNLLARDNPIANLYIAL